MEIGESIFGGKKMDGFPSQDFLTIKDGSNSSTDYPNIIWNSIRTIGAGRDDITDRCLSPLSYSHKLKSILIISNI
jgi:hypothetical protein